MRPTVKGRQQPDGTVPAPRLPGGAALLAVHALVLAAWSLLVPVYQAPDEPQHVDLALALSEGEPWPAHRTRQVDARVLASLPFVGFEAFEEPVPDPLVAADAPPRAARPSFDALGPRAQSSDTNMITQHPPLYHTLAGATLAAADALPGPLPFDRAVGTLRLLSVVLVAPLVLCARAAARRLLGDERVALAAGLGVMAIPQLSHIGSAANNDALLVALFGVLTVPVAAVLSGDLRARTALAAGVLGGLALLTKGLALVLLVWLPAGYGVALLRDRRRVRQALGSCALATGLTAALGGWWWVRNLAEEGRLLPLGESYPGAPDSFIPDLAVWTSRWVGGLARSYWGAFGWLDVLAPLALPGLASLAVLVLGGLALLRGHRGGRRADFAVLVLPTVALAAGMAARSWSDYTRVADLLGLQGRYLFPGVAALAVVVAAGAAALAGRRVAALAFAAVLAAQITGIFTVLDAYWGGRADAVLAWSPWPAAVTLAVLGGAVAAFAAVGVAVLRTSGTRADREAAPVDAPGATTTRQSRQTASSSAGTTARPAEADAHP